ncbi:NAD+ synthase [Luteitalea sp. TBR-22]|uniref:NAD+ synthase n=1 Tax=Luteitalea sp. TBR-22 TaxID=2802971 RepID=UPI001AF365DE|nr:NAD+ synthase [Luteitalea sp. TBR-22]BCS33491.1 NAD+ synthase [Luteitalea sp. TBR-22]
MRIALLQLDPTVGALDANAARIEAAVRAIGSRADLCVTPEMALTGYPPRDLLLMPGFVARCREVADRLAASLATAPGVLLGMPVPSGVEAGRPLLNAAVHLRAGTVGESFAKTLLPTYDVFDEDRYFEPGRAVGALAVGERRVAVSICEDVWNDPDVWTTRRYGGDPVAALRDLATPVMVNMSASPYAQGKLAQRERLLAHLARKYGVWALYANQVGANDDLVFDGRSLAFAPDGTCVARGAAFAEDTVIVDTSSPVRAVVPDETPVEAEVFAALVLGVRDYARKCGFRDALLGLSGGIDSALTAVIAVEALGREHVTGVLMPSPYSSQGSVADAETLAATLGIRTQTLPIAPVMTAYDGVLAGPFAGLAPDVTEENLQARIRGALLMALSNKTGALLLTTGNKSELATGYCTLYGDMNGALAVIADVYKTLVYRVARWVNRGGVVIPEATITKAPSAELRPNQTDQDSLPPYDVLDAILEGHVERCLDGAALVEEGFDGEVVRQVLRLVRISEFKRKQAAPVLKVTSRAFGTGWRMPIARA